MNYDIWYFIMYAMHLLVFLRTVIVLTIIIMEKEKRTNAAKFMTSISLFVASSLNCIWWFDLYTGVDADDHFFGRLGLIVDRGSQVFLFAAFLLMALVWKDILNSSTSMRKMNNTTLGKEKKLTIFVLFGSLFALIIPMYTLIILKIQVRAYTPSLSIPPITEYCHTASLTHLPYPLEQPGYCASPDHLIQTFVTACDHH